MEQDNALLRLGFGLLLAILVNYGLFTVMQHMTAPQAVKRHTLQNIQLLDFVRLKKEQTPPETKKRELPKKPPPPKQPPPPPKTPTPNPPKPKAPAPKMDVPNIKVPLNIAGGPYLGDFKSAPKAAPAPVPVAAPAPALDNEVIPLVRIPPRYPRMAARRGIEGAVTLSFIITKDGLVRNPVVVKAKPENVFDQAAIEAIKQWKFKPKVVDGKPVERRATQQIEFKLTR